MHFHVIVWAAEGRDGGNFTGVTYLDVIVKKVTEAVPRAKELFPKRKHYWVNNVIEHHEHVTTPDI